MKYGSGGIAVITVIWWNSLNNDLVFIVVVHLVSICVLSIAFRDQSHYSIVQFMRYVTRGGFTNFVTMPYLGEEGPKLRKLHFVLTNVGLWPTPFGLVWKYVQIVQALCLMAVVQSFTVKNTRVGPQLLLTDSNWVTKWTFMEIRIQQFIINSYLILYFLNSFFGYYHTTENLSYLLVNYGSNFFFSLKGFCLCNSHLVGCWIFCHAV